VTAIRRSRKSPIESGPARGTPPAMPALMPRARWSLVALASLPLASRDAAAICREVTEKGSRPPVIAADQEILVIKRSGVPFGCQPQTPPADAAPSDAGLFDGGLLDAAASDAATDPADAAAADAAPAGDAAPGDAAPCQPHQADTITWVVQPRFSTGPDGARFALLMVTPRPPVIELAPSTTFADLARATAPLETVEERYVEDESLGSQCDDPKSGGAGCGSTTTTGGDGSWKPPPLGGGGAADASGIDGYVPVTTVGSYQVVVLDAADGDALAAWLDGAGYAHEPADIDALRPYLELGWTVTAVRVASTQAVDAGGLEPLSFTFEGTDLRLPLGVARQPLGARALIQIYIAAEGRYEVPGAGLSYASWTDNLSTFLTASLLDADLSRPADADPVAIRARSDDYFQDSYTVIREIHIPVSCPAGDGFDLCDCRTAGRPADHLPTVLLLAAALALLFRRRRGRDGRRI
jgi:MYXO-CTERM domain-containing protein